MKRILNRNFIRDALLVLSIISICLAFISVACVAHIQYSRNKVWESRAKSTMRAYGEIQLAYQNSNNDHHWGTWEALVETEYIPRIYTRGNIIENYSLWTSVLNYSPPGAIICGIADNTFTAVAFPRITRPPGYLSTFGIREDEVLRVYTLRSGVNAWGEAGDYGTLTWEPIR